ncbi:MAG TPA: cellulase family glycosylhydrolase [Verrucomicrobiales bacterium]|nr:cellulase family glycosylhydrolase [Verrucomicrobiales bacterium]
MSADGTGFVLSETGRPWVGWGFNYDHDHAGRLLEDYWAEEWSIIEEDFREMRDLGANVVRIHLQLGRFMISADRADEASLERLSRLLALAGETGIYLNLTGLGCYHRADIPAWYDVLDEQERWQAQERFWEAVARTCAHSPWVFCYDLMNEPVLPGEDKVETDWLTGELGGKFFVQRISLDLAGRSRTEVVRAWIERMVAAIRRHDQQALTTVGVIPWAHVFPGAKPLFHGEEAGGKLDFVSVHFYPKSGKIAEALTALRVYETGKPLVVEEMFPLACTIDELGEFIDAGQAIVDGWIGFYWGKKVEDYGTADGIAGAMTRQWLQYFREKAAARKAAE